VPRESVIEPLVGQYYHLSPLRRVAADTRDGWSAEWRGFIDVPTSGTYGFQVERVSRAGLWIDERVVFDETPEDAPEVNFGSVALTAGRHAIRVRLQNRNAGGPRLYLYWIPPGGQREVVPGRALYPVPPAIQ
jgi:alpha-L-fucosidase